MTERKSRIRQAFDAAAPGYEAAALPQARVAAMLADRLGPLPADARILEVGCGTGLLTRHLLGRMGPGNRLLATDLSPAMVAKAQECLPDPRVAFQVMDAEAPPAGLGRFDRVVSSLAAQWFGDLEGALSRLAGLLAPGGVLTLTTLGEGSFRQWRDLLARLGLEAGIPDYLGSASLAALLPGARVEDACIDIAHGDARLFLKSLEEMGAATPKPGHRPLGAGSMRRVLAQAGTPFTVTWHVLFLEFRR